jgi:hypothetical protein
MIRVQPPSAGWHDPVQLQVRLTPATALLEERTRTVERCGRSATRPMIDVERLRATLRQLCGQRGYEPPKGVNWGITRIAENQLPERT